MAGRQDSSSQPSSSRRLAGRSIGQFIIDKDIGKGSFAQVYMGWHKETKAAVAIKSVELERLNKKLRENLYGEIQILKTLRHPHIVALHDCVESSTHINLIMEYCELGDLSMFIKKRDKLATHPATHDMARKYPSAQNSGLHEVIIRHFLKQLASALEFLRQKNYVHRDVKPQNLLLLPSQAFRSTRSFNIMEASQDSLIPVAGLTSLPMLKLADFGFARVLPSTSLADTLCGSPLYMAPEILRYERYDAKADLWSVGTVLYEMTTGKPPFRARNHVELLRKIEAAEDVIKFPREVSVGSEIKGLIRSLLKRSPVERLSFENFFVHPVVTSDIPGLVEDDVPRPPKQELRAIQPKDTVSASGKASVPQSVGNERAVESGSSRSPRELQGRPTQADSPGEGRNQRPSGIAQRINSSPREIGEGLGIQRPQAHHTASMPTRPQTYRSGSRDIPSSSSGAQPQETRKTRMSSGRSVTEEDKAAQDVMFERDYVVVERRQVEVNALADELAANEKLGSPSPTSPRSTAMSRRYTQQGAPTSTTGAIPTPASQTALVAQGRGSHDRRSSYEKALSGSPSSASSAISKAIQDASLRLFGFKVSTGGAKGSSPPMYHAFPVYPTPSLPLGTLGDGREHHGDDENASAAQSIEDFATRSDCVYGFAEVKYKQLVPLAPSMDHGIGGIEAEQLSADEEGLTIEAVVSLSEESLVLYVKSLSLLAKAMDIASMWWAQKSRAEATTGLMAGLSQNDVKRINAVVQWVRQRFNEVLEKSEIVRLKLIEAQKKLPEDHPSHPSNLDAESTTSSGGSSWKPVHLTPGISAEKLMYDRALEMSRAAAIDEVTNENLPGCELSYITAIRMLEAVLDTPDESAVKKLPPSSKSSGKETLKQSSGDLDSDEEAHVRKMIKMITGRLSAVRKKLQMIADANSKVPHSPQLPSKRRSGDTTPRSVPSHASS